jgi:alpha 1,2-mannosyltransferase
MIVINSNQRKPLLLTAGCLLFCVFFFFWPLKAPNNNEKTYSSSHSSLINHPNLPDPSLPPAWHNTTRVKAAFVILTRNNELDALRKTIQQLEARFNHKFNYPYVFLNDVEFTQEFKDLTSSLTNAETKYGIVKLSSFAFVLLNFNFQFRHYSTGTLELSRLD